MTRRINNCGNVVTGDKLIELSFVCCLVAVCYLVLRLIEAETVCIICVWMSTINCVHKILAIICMDVLLSPPKKTRDIDLYFIIFTYFKKHNFIKTF